MTEDSKTNAADGELSPREFAAMSVAAGVAAAGGAQAADAAVAESDVTIKTPSGVCDAAFFHPQGSGPWPAAIIFPDALGLRPEFREMGRRLASSGYAVLVPNPFYRTRKAPVISGPFDFNNPADRAKLVELQAPINAEGVASDASALIGFLDKQPVVNRKAGIGVSGYCMGGRYTMIAAATSPDRVAAGASFHGGGLVTDKPDSPHLLAPRMKAQYYFGIAANDDQRQPEAKDKLREAFAAAGRPAKIEVYDKSQHGWCVKGSAVYNEPDAERAWSELLALYKRALV